MCGTWRNESLAIDPGDASHEFNGPSRLLRAVTGSSSLRWRRGLSTLLGFVLAGLGAAFVAWSLADEWGRVLEATTGARPLWLGAGFVFGMAGIVHLGLGWRRALELLGFPCSRRDALRWYFVGQLGKYVPGGVWAVVGSAELAAGEGASRARAYGAMLLALGCGYLAGILAVAGLLPFEVGLLQGLPTVGFLLVLIPLGVLAVHPAVLGYVLEFTRRVSRWPIELEVPRWGSSLRLVGWHLPAWLGLGLATWCVARALEGPVPVVNIMLAGILAWVVGFLVVPAPGGLGVREAVFTVAATSLSSGMAAAVAVVARVVFVMVDVAGAGLVLLARPGGRGSRGSEPDAFPPTFTSDVDD